MQEQELKQLCPSHEPITKAPTMGDLKQRAEKAGKALEEVLEQERGNLYSSTNSAGDIFLIQNPAAWAEKIVNGSVVKVRPQPILFSTAKREARKLVGPI